MRNPRGPTGEMPAPRLCIAMHLTASRRRGLIPDSDGTDLSKCPYIDACNHRRCRAISRDIGGYSAVERCMVHDAPLPEVAR